MPLVYILNSDAAVTQAIKSALGSECWDTRALTELTEFLSHPRAAVSSCLVLDLEAFHACPPDLRAIICNQPETPVIVTAKSPTLPGAVAAIKAGAADFLAEPLEGEPLRNAVIDALNRSCEAVNHRVALDSLHRRYSSLTKREREVIAGIVAGKMNKAVAHDLGISVVTVKAHRGQVMRKMGATSLAGLIHMATRLGRSPSQGKATEEATAPDNHSKYWAPELASDAIRDHRKGAQWQLHGTPAHRA